MLRRTPGLLVVLSSFALSACAHVAPYDRERLADPTMQLDDMSGAAEGHVHAVHEGAAGGSVVAASGCGCN
ncbi:MAG TPA: DUF4266 domain-containing protein [Polyangiaceae bacterium]|nr:DUF4266 domain-containing protein [Polyangiaceae bacterium]